MPERREESEVERIIVAAIEEHARGDVVRPARGIVLELYRAGLEIRERGGQRDDR